MDKRKRDAPPYAHTKKGEVGTVAHENQPLQALGLEVCVKKAKTGIVTLFMALALAVGMSFVLVGCSNGEGTDGTDGSGAAAIANPVVEVESVADINKQLGINLVIPEDAVVEYCAVIGSSLGEARFVLDGRLFTYRGQVTDEDVDISGLYYDFSTSETSDVDGQAYVLGFTEGGPGYARWFVNATDTVYSVSIESGSTESGDTGAVLNDIAVALITAQK